MIDIQMQARRSGKRALAEMMRELALEEGKTVVEYSPGYTTFYKRKKHLTSIEVIAASPLVGLNNNLPFEWY